ncbi:hypothetical protein Q3G72_035601 [Acer saccharum]|nr:hypothetical protein Q3G72_035601 [Acer saccharum]
MATPFVILKEVQHPPCRKSMQISKQAARFLPVSTGECHSRSIKGHSKERTRNGFIVSIRSTEHVQLYSQNCAKAHRRKQLCMVRELPRLGFLYFKSSIRYILRKARAFYNELACDNYDVDIPTVLGDQVMGVDPYFSIPVIHPPNAALIV